MKNKVSDTEYEVMEYLWSQGQGVAFASLLDFFNNEKKKKWSKQTLNTYLMRLKNKGYVQRKKTGEKSVYTATITKKEHQRLCAEEILDEFYGGTLLNFICALTGKNKLTNEEEKRLLEYIEEREE